MKLLSIIGLGAILAGQAAWGEVIPKGMKNDLRLRTALYDPAQVYTIETDLKLATTIRFGEGERFKAVIVGDTESFQVDPLAELGNVLAIKPHVAGAHTNMTVITNQHSYAFELREGTMAGSGGKFFEVRFEYPDRGSKTGARYTAKGYDAPKHYGYRVSGKADFMPVNIFDDGKYTYFVFSETQRQPTVFKVDGANGNERSVNWTQVDQSIRVLGVQENWSLRLDGQVICVKRSTAAVSNNG
jgi:type IV secretion system protein VirB9